MASQKSSFIQELLEKWDKAGHGHIKHHYEQNEQKCDENFIKMLQHIDIDRINRMYNGLKSRQSGLDKEKETPKMKIEPFKAPIIASQRPTEKIEWKNKGMELISQGKVAIVLLAGGQGTRLGSSLPKGCYDIGLPSHKSLFQLQAERIMRLKHLVQNMEIKKSADVLSIMPIPDINATIRETQTQTNKISDIRLPWYIMTSNQTKNPTFKFFEEAKYFGLDPSDVIFFNQGELPALSLDGKVLISSEKEIALSPNGNGGIYSALKENAILDDMKRRGIEHVHIYGVDNALVKPGDPIFVGFAATLGADCVNKVTLRTNPTEKVGVMCYVDGKPSVVEYTEIGKEATEMKNGELIYNQANIANHYFSYDLLCKVAHKSHCMELPFHEAIKDIPTINSSNEKIIQKGIKFEMFIFDAFAFSVNMLTFAIERSEEFSPVKNAGEDSSITDSPATARRDIYELHIQRAKAAGLSDSERKPGECFEISPLISYDGEDIKDINFLF